MQLPCLVKLFGKCRRMISRDKKAGGNHLYKFMYLHLGNIVGNSTPQWICMIPSNRRYQIRLYKLCLCLTYLTCPIQHFTHQQDSRQNTLLLSYSMADPSTSTTSEPLPIAIIGMYVEIHATISYIHFHRRNFFSLLLFFILTNKKKITKSIGAGIAGLALAIGLHNNNNNNSQEKKKKIPFILYEEASEFSAVG